MEQVGQFLKWAEEKGWQIQCRSKMDIDLPNHILLRYPKIPQEFLKFLKEVEYCITPDEKSWFICLKEYKGTSDFAFTWDEIEKMSLVEGDDSYNEEIIKFWNKHLPIALSVRSEYTYYALDVGDDFGSIVHSFEPYFEEPEKIASSFFEFLDKIMTNSIDF